MLVPRGESQVLGRFGPPDQHFTGGCLTEEALMVTGQTSRCDLKAQSPSGRTVAFHRNERRGGVPAQELRMRAGYRYAGIGIGPRGVCSAHWPGAIAYRRKQITPADEQLLALRLLWLNDNWALLDRLVMVSVAA